MKKTICLMTEWYPSKENPYRGVFFKEQAFAVSDRFDFLVLHYREQPKKKPGRRFHVQKTNEENNTAEYDVTAYVPLTVLLRDIVRSFLVRRSPGRRKDGVGRYLSEKHKRFTQNTLRQVFQTHLPQKIDAFYCVDAQREAFFLSCAAQARHAPYVVSEHAPVPWPGTLISDADHAAIEQADLFFAISQDKIRQLLLQNLHLPRTVYIGNLIDETRLRIVPGEALRVKTLIIVAANSFYKNYDLFIRVMDRLTEITDAPFRVMIVGYGANKGYSKKTKELEEKIRASRFAGRAEMIPEVPHEKIGETLARADAFVMTSIQEGQPVSAMEAACCGLPIFSTRCGGVEDYVDDTLGRIYAVTDAEGMARGLRDYLEGRIVFDSRHIRDTVVARFGLNAFRKTFVDAFTEVTAHD